MTWPSVDAPASAPSDHGEVRTQAYYAGGGDYFRSGYFHWGIFSSTAVVPTALVQDRLYLSPFIVPVRRAFDRIGVWVQTASGAGGVLRLGIYAPGAGAPGALVVDGGTVSCTTTGSKEVVISETLNPGIYWTAVVAQVSASPPAIPLYPADHMSPFMGRDTTANNNTASKSGWIVSSVSGALPSSVSPTSTATAVMLQLRAA